MFTTWILTAAMLSPTDAPKMKYVLDENGVVRAETPDQPVSLPIVVGPDAVVKARPWEMRWQEVYERVSNGREQLIVVGSDAKGATRCDDGPKVGDKFTFVEDGTGAAKEFVIEAGKVYRCFLSDKGVPSIEPRDKPKPVRDAAKKVILGAVDFVTPPFGITNPANCIGNT